MPRISSLVLLSCTPVFCRSGAGCGAGRNPGGDSFRDHRTDSTDGRSRHSISANESAAWLKTRKCAACHHVPMPLWALGEAERQGYAIDKKFVTDTIESLLGSKDKLMASRIFPNPADKPDPRPQGRGLNLGLPMLAVAAQSLPALTEGQRQSLKLIADEIVKKQQPDGSWEFFATLRRPPINESQTTDAAWIILALQGMTGPDAPTRSARRWRKPLPGSTPPNVDLHQDKVYERAPGGSHRQAAPIDASHDRRVAGPATRRRRLEPDRARPEERRLCHRPDLVCLVACRLHGRSARNQAGDRLLGRHAKAGRQLADDFSSDARRHARQLEAAYADHLRRQLLGHAGPGEPRAEGKAGVESRRRSQRSENTHEDRRPTTKAAS